MILVLGVLSTNRSLAFGLSLGVSRRSYFVGTASLAVAMAAVYGLALTILQEIERATDGWGMRLHFFRVGYLLSGPWYLTWLTSFVGLTLVFVYGSWFGLVYRRWNIAWTAGFHRCPGHRTARRGTGRHLGRRLGEYWQILHHSQRVGIDWCAGRSRSSVICRRVCNDPQGDRLSADFRRYGPSELAWRERRTA